MLGLGVCLAGAHCAPAPPGVKLSVQDFTGRLAAPPVIRAAVLREATRVDLSCRGGVRMFGPDLVQPLKDLESFAGLDARATSTGIRLGRDEWRVDVLALKPLGREPVRVAGRAYRGAVALVRTGDSRLAGVNVIDVEEYLCGVLGSEMPLRWPDEALKAQVVAARTYALHRKVRRRTAPYDLVANLHEAYAGASGETSRAREMVEATRGIVMLYDWALFPAYYHSTCGGATEDVRHVFSIEPSVASNEPAFLRGVPCTFCRTSRHYSWRREFSAEALARRLQPAIPGIRSVRNIVPLGRGTSGRATFARVQYEAAGPDNPLQDKTLRAAEFRMLIGPDRLKSAWFNVTRRGDTFIFNGRGWGHGVGLCQYGARGLADRGADFRRILGYYYRGVELVKIY